MTAQTGPDSAGIVIVVPAPCCSFTAPGGGQLELYGFGTFVERLAERFTVIRYDKPGCGLADGDGVDLSFDGQVAAALAVADTVGAGRFGRFGASQGGQLAAAIAARYPDRVDALVL